MNKDPRPLDAFNLEGTHYFQQGRKCNKPACHCASGRPEDLHGPYWFQRDSSGKVTYIGRELPDVVVKTREEYNRLWVRMQRFKRELQEQVDAVQKLIDRDTLTADERVILKNLGLEEALLPFRTGE